jgi:hypothetical protein
MTASQWIGILLAVACLCAGVSMLVSLFLWKMLGFIFGYRRGGAGGRGCAGVAALVVFASEHTHGLIIGSEFAKGTADD